MSWRSAPRGARTGARACLGRRGDCLPLPVPSLVGRGSGGPTGWCRSSGVSVGDPCRRWGQ
eukprot:3517686-Pyramimonas_sp.AAC.1